MNKKFIREVLKLNPEMAVTNNHFYILPVDHVLTGFLCEKCPGGVYLWKFAFPLYDHVADHISLGYGERFGSFHDSATTSSPVILANEFTKQISRHKNEIFSLSTIDGFLSYIERIGSNSLENPWIRRGYATTLIMANHKDAARKELKALRNQEGLSFKKDLDQLLHDLDEGLEIARDRLKSWEAKTKFNLQLNQ